MDIVSRIKIFMNYLNIANSQFADSCRIPRPTISQILNGRNKKISDEIISKIHDTYPTLSILWLMFGEGDMLINSNIKISEPQNSSTIDFGTSNHADSENIIPEFNFEDSDNEIAPNNFSDENTALNTEKLSLSNTESITKSPKELKTSISFNTDTTKKIVNIMVFYNDNSFESFTPSIATKN